MPPSDSLEGPYAPQQGLCRLPRQQVCLFGVTLPLLFYYGLKSLITVHGFPKSLGLGYSSENATKKGYVLEHIGQTHWEVFVILHT